MKIKEVLGNEAKGKKKFRKMYFSKNPNFEPL
jgi:hypothetical protein